MKTIYKTTIENIAIALLSLIGFKNIFLSLFPKLKITNHIAAFVDRYFSLQLFAFHKIISFILGILMIFLVYHLYKRVRVAWMIQVFALVISIAIHIFQGHHILIPSVILESIILFILVYFQKDFSRKSNRLTIRWALFISLTLFAVVSLNSIIGLLVLVHNKEIHSSKDTIDFLKQYFNLIFLFDSSNYVFKNNFTKMYVFSLATINWIGLIVSFLLILTPLIFKPKPVQKEKIRKLVLDYGQNPMSYLTLEDDKKYFLGTKSNGVAAYTVADNVFVCCGDMICSKEDGEIFLSEIEDFCFQNGYKILFLNITEYFKEVYEKNTYGIIKYGEDACFELSKFSLAGGKIAKVRAEVNKANKEGITVFEYKPAEKRDVELEKSIDEISNDWLQNKSSSEMSFMLGGTGLEDPMDRRYFCANDLDGNLVGFVVFIPYMQKKAYLADVTRYRKNGPRGVLEKIITDAFFQMRDEGVLYGSMGLSPLYNIGESDRLTITEKLFTFIYNNINKGYGFKSLHSAKEKYAPTDWQPRYIAFKPTPFTPQLAYSIVKAQNPKGVVGLVLSSILPQKSSGDGNESK